VHFASREWGEAVGCYTIACRLLRAGVELAAEAAVGKHGLQAFVLPPTGQPGGESLSAPEQLRTYEADLAFAARVRDQLVAEAGRQAEQQLSAGALDGALRYAMRAVEMDPDHIPSQQALAFLRQRQRQTAAAQAAKEEHLAAGKQHLEAQEWNLAAASLATAMKFDPEDAVLTQALAFAVQEAEEEARLGRL
jgi:Tfp pilus assembly protein PilF